MRGLTLRDPAFLASLSNAIDYGPIGELQPLILFDFSNQSTVTTSNSRITAIQNLGSLPWALNSVNNGPLYSNGANGMMAANWGSTPHSNLLRTSDSTSYGIGEFYFVLDGDFGNGFVTSNNGLASTTIQTGNVSTQWAISGSYASSGLSTTEGYNVFSVNGAPPSSIVVPDINNLSLLRAQSIDFPPNPPQGIITTNGFQLGGLWETSLNGWFGFLYMAIGFSTPLSESDRSVVQIWLANRYNFTLS